MIFFVLIFFSWRDWGKRGMGGFDFLILLYNQNRYPYPTVTASAQGKSISPPESRSKWFSRGYGIGSPFNVGWVTADERLKVKWRPLSKLSLTYGNAGRETTYHGVAGQRG